jgi:TrmH family RNA methyltransferase
MSAKSSIAAVAAATKEGVQRIITSAMPVSEARERLRRIESRQNPLVKELRRGFATGELSPAGECAIESIRIVEEAIRSGLRFRAVFFAESALDKAARLLPQIGAKVETVLLPDEVFASAVATENPQGVAALVAFRLWELENLLSIDVPFFVVAAGVQDPGNLGTIVRSAEAFGANALLAAEKTVSPFNAKVVRASAGSIFRLPVVRAKIEDVVARLRERNVRLIATSSHKGVPIHEADLRAGVALFIGGEGLGLPREILAAADEIISIPHAKVESLNAGVAASIVLYEAAKQRSIAQRRPRGAES